MAIGSESAVSSPVPSKAGFKWYCLPPSTALQTSQPQFKDGSVYSEKRPTKLDEIKNLYVAVPVGSVDSLLRTGQSPITAQYKLPGKAVTYSIIASSPPASAPT